MRSMPTGRARRRPWRRRVQEIMTAIADAGLQDRTDVVVLSDHGFLPLERQLQVNAALKQEGLLEVDAAGKIVTWSAYFYSAGESAFVILKDPTDAAVRARRRAAEEPGRRSGEWDPHRLERAGAAQVTRRLRFLMRVEIRRRAHDGRALIGGHSHCNHVALDELTEVNARVEVPADKIEAHFVRRRDVEHDVGVCIRKCAEFRRKHHRRRQRRYDETHASGRAFPAFGNVVQYGRDIPERGTQPAEQLLAGVRRCNAAVVRDRSRAPMRSSRPRIRRVWDPSYFWETSLRYQRRIVSGVTIPDTAARRRRPRRMPFTARRRRWSSVRRG
jgi:Type I phosphodiesterase / nucleotide pyrophosphatase